MPKAVLISIRPGWAEKIISGEKTVEVRKNRPKLTTPFKCYIYCTKDARDSDILWVLNGQQREKYDGLSAVCANFAVPPEGTNVGNGKVIGEFVCDKIDRIVQVGYMGTREPLTRKILDNRTMWTYPIDDLLNAACLTADNLDEYLGGYEGDGWHISNLKIYDTPRELGEFKRIARDCFYADLGLAKRDCPDCKNPECFLQRPPQSWCYVEELRNG